MAIDIEQITKNYADLEDYKIEQLAKNEVGGLEPDVIPILINEIKKRKLDSGLIVGIEAQIKEMTETVLTELKAKIANLTCPICGQQQTPLVGSLIRKVRSYILFTTYNKTPIISCRSCADKKRRNAMISTAILGWWGIPWGIIRTPHAIVSSMLDSRKREKLSESIITGFAIENIGVIRANWNKECDLVDFIAHTNRQK